MPENLNQPQYRDEVEEQIDQGLSFTEAEKNTWWDVIAAGKQDASSSPRHRAETPLLTYEDTPRQSEPLLEAGETEPLLEASYPDSVEIEPTPLEFANFDEPTNELFDDEDELTPEEQAVLERALPAPTLNVPSLEAPVADREPRVPKHAAELHEAQEDFSPEDRVNNLLMVANHIIERRKTANATGEKIESADDITAFVELFAQYKAEFKANDVDDSSLELVGKFVTGAYEIIDGLAPVVEEGLDAPYSTEVRNRPENHLEQPGFDPEVVEETLSRFFVGDNVGFLVDDNKLEGGWVIKNERYVKDPAYREHLVEQYKDHVPGAAIEPFPESAKGGYHEYTIVKDGQEHQGVREEQLEFVSESAPIGVQGPDRGPIQGYEPVTAESTPAHPEVKWTSPLTPEAVVPATPEEIEEDELGGVDDLVEVEEELKPTGAATVTGEIVSITPEKSRLDKIRDLKKVFGVKYWSQKWDKMGENPGQRRNFIIAGTAAVLLVAAIAHGSKDSSNDTAPEEASASPTPAATDIFTSSPNIIDGDKVTINTSNGAAEKSGAAETQDATEYPKGTFSVKLDQGPLTTVNSMGYTDDKWYSIAESMNTDFPEYFYKAGNDIRYNHVGELPKRVQTAFINRLKGA